MNNFVSVFEELSKLYEADELEQDTAAEAAEDAEVSDVPAADEPKQLVLECTKCGALAVKPEEDVVVDEATDLANVEEACASCEETAGFKVLGELLPYAVAEDTTDADDDIVEESVDPETPAQAPDTEPAPSEPESAPSKEADPEPAVTEELLESVLTEGKLLDNVKKVVSRVGADATTILRCFTELGEMIKNAGNDGEYKTSKLNDFMEYVENKAVLKALINGNESVLNGTTKEDIEELAQEIEDYKKAKAEEPAEDAE